jgi:competence protein ComEA
MKKLLTIWLVMLLTAALVRSSPSKEQAATTATKESGTTAETKKAPKELLDINNASTDELKSLGGIDDATAKKIVENRPYEREDQLVSQKIISRQTYVRIKDRIIAKQAKQTKTK